jgi:hypothetical protein
LLSGFFPDGDRADHFAVRQFHPYAQTFAQRQTPPHMLGKVFAFVTVLCICAFPVGNALYGVLFDAAGDKAALILFFACGASLIIALLAGRLQKRLPAEAVHPRRTVRKLK